MDWKSSSTSSQLCPACRAVGAVDDRTPKNGRSSSTTGPDPPNPDARGVSSSVQATRPTPRTSAPSAAATRVPVLLVRIRMPV